MIEGKVRFMSHIIFETRSLSYKSTRPWCTNLLMAISIAVTFSLQPLSRTVLWRLSTGSSLAGHSSTGNLARHTGLLGERRSGQ
ncbi:uncharacterized protein BP01DRAFT_105867 [Aspergillus saccharolyticus JOP 1030-1]|uniref:Uncharacterized protein n=1 Tax=Aspergillus saccharolyticus JOP 1030-1 TaxID=1450539 RepID=A0A318Z9X6_9EURO|nr:hypothetical protein BP01DRAFT_105867 [Aspergillus saccharolyticus JOP 1030-1]PYH43237.1 hypothetical protein BP01DRAFT_105867 [Aspergillus saccharolyticus JOP 1030-1]